MLENRCSASRCMRIGMDIQILTDRLAALKNRVQAMLGIWKTHWVTFCIWIGVIKRPLEDNDNLIGWRYISLDQLHDLSETKRRTNWYGRFRRCLRIRRYSGCMLFKGNNFVKRKTTWNSTYGGGTYLLPEFKNCYMQQWTAGEPGNYFNSTKDPHTNRNSNGILRYWEFYWPARSGQPALLQKMP